MDFTFVSAHFELHPIITRWSYTGERVAGQYIADTITF